MEHDIDIEEHDVLDNPRIKTIFPNLTQVKVETPDDGYEGSSQDSQYNAVHEYNRYNNFIILGRKPSSVSQINIKQEIDEEESEDQETAVETHATSGNAFGPSVLIIGSKPAPNLSCVSLRDNAESLDSITRDSYSELYDLNTENEIKESSVVLEDWGSKLFNNPCFCRKCDILFATTNTLQAHNMTAHSFLVALRKNVALKSTAKMNKALKSTAKSNIALKSTAKSNTALKITAKPNIGHKIVSMSSGNHCNHCNKIFPDSDTLISHLYQSLTFDKSKGVFNKSNKSDDKVTPKAVVSPFEARTTSISEIEKKKEFNNSETTLNDGLLFRCPICTCYFTRYMFYSKHMIKNHQSDPNNIPKCLQEPYNGRCKFCGISLSRKGNFNAHVTNFHSKITFAAEPKIGASKTVKPHKFRCLKCNVVCHSYREAGVHRMTRHPETRNKLLFKKIIYSTVKPSVSVQSARVSSAVPVPKLIPKTKQSASENSLIPISVLYKCASCGVHFTSCSACLSHSETCQRTKGGWTCHICKRDFDMADWTTHRLQHQHSKTFDVYNSNDNLYGRVLNQCPDCSTHLYEKHFKFHTKNECEGFSVKCGSCNLLIHKSSLDQHTHWHNNANEDMIIVKFAKTGGVPHPVPVKRKLTDDDAAIVPKRLKQEAFHPKATFYYCMHCQVFMNRAINLNSHLDGSCISRGLPRIEKCICKICGLSVSSKKHQRIHDTSLKKATFFDLRFVRMQDKKVIYPPIPTFPKCTVCNTHFCSNTSIGEHCCDDAHKICKYCHKKFSDLAYSLHVRFHEYQRRFSIGKNGRTLELKATYTDEVAKPKLIPKESNTNTALVMPELLKKYHMLNDVWNLLYRCETCDIVCDNYDYAIEHCQKHYNNTESYDVIVKNCKICSFNFDSQCFEKHRDQHIQNKQLNKNSFKILNYNYTKLLTKEWPEIFTSIPPPQVTQIMSKSIYSLRSVKLRLVNDVPSEYVLYKCGKCKKFEHPLSVSIHASTASCTDIKTSYECRECSLKFTSHFARSHHEQLHSKTKDFKLVLFNERGDEEYNKSLWNISRTIKANDQEQSNRSLKGPSKRKIKSTEKKAIHYYKCIKCRACILLRDMAKLHRCQREGCVIRCDVCKLDFSRNVMTRHIRYQCSYKFKTKKIILTMFSPKSDDAPCRFKETIEQSSGLEKDDRVRLFRCRCGLHFTSVPSYKHYSICGDGEKISTEKCSKCGRLFDTTQLVAHLLKHHRSGVKAKFEVIPVAPGKKPTVFKCNKCDVFFCKKIHCMKHTCNTGTICSLCGLKFHSVVKHLQRHKPCSEMLESDYNVISFTPKKFVERRGKLYKCNRCDVYYLSLKALKYHCDTNHGVNKVVSCPKCQYNFMPTTLKRHKILHHVNTKLQREDFQIFVAAQNSEDGRMEIISSQFSDVRDVKGSKNDIPTNEHNNKCSENNKPVKNTSPGPQYNEQHSDKLNLKHFSNILFRCGVCETHFLTRNTIIRHFRRMPRRHGMAKRKAKCEQCGYLFSAFSMENHEYVHHKIMKLNRGDFEIKLTTESGLFSTVFDEAPPDNNMNVERSDDDETDTSKNVRGKELVDLKKQAFDLENILFKCKECNIHFNCESFRRYHIEPFHKKPFEKITCLICNLDFSKVSYSKHDILHKQKILTRDDFYVVPYTVFGNGMVTDYLYQCHTCYVVFGRLKHLETHMKDNFHNIANKKCNKCNLYFKSSHLANHLKVHHETMKLDLADFVMMRSNAEQMVEIVRVSEQFTSSNIDDNSDHDETNYISQTKNSDEMDVDDESATAISGVNISQTKDIHGNDLNQHNDDVHINLTRRLVRTEFFAIYNRNIYKCSQCAVYFLRLRSLETHIERHPEGRAIGSDWKNCSECGLRFSVLVLPKHQRIHHKDLQLKKDDFHILDEFKVNNLVLDNTLKSYKLTKKIFRCHKCFLNCNTYVALEGHVAACSGSDEKVECDVCGLHFLTDSCLEEHKHIYHEELNISLNDFEVYNAYLEKIETSHDADVKRIYPNKISAKVDENEPEMITRQISTLNKDLYTNELYRCSVCSVHFLTREHLDWHVKNSNHNVNKSNCTSCDLPFGITTLPTHVYIHHEKLSLQVRDFYVMSSDDTVESIDPSPSCGTELDPTPSCSTETDLSPSCRTKVKNVNIGSLLKEDVSSRKVAVEMLEDNDEDEMTRKSNAENNSNEDNDSSIDIEANLDVEITDSSRTSHLDINQSSSKVGTNTGKEKIKFYKCAACNVCFLTQMSCYRHTSKHVPLDPKDYIECKLCGFQFLIVNTLHAHITKHHNSPFNPEDAVIEEYNPNELCHGSPKIKIYSGAEKLQSESVSTTSEAIISKENIED